MLRPAVAAISRDKAGKSGFGIGRQRLSVKKGFENGREPQSARAGAGRQRRGGTAVVGYPRALEAVQRRRWRQASARSGRAGIFARDSVKIPTYPRLFS